MQSLQPVIKMEDWDSDTFQYIPKKYEKNDGLVGKTFGGRGRGFVLDKFSSQADAKYNKWVNKTEDFSGYKCNNNMKNVNHVSGQSRDANNQRKPKSTYVPDAPTEDDNEIFGNGISSGINFKNYEKIKVKVSGENYPSPIQDFTQAGLLPEILNIIERCNYSTPTPIQKYSIPIVMNRRDMMACAQTGSGKTAAFLIPIINSLLQEFGKIDLDTICQPQALILSPTRELAIQIFNEARKFSRGTPLKAAIIYGGTAVYHQVEKIKMGCEILVATPGRLLDFLDRGLLEFKQTRYLVLDEADRMLNMGFLPEMKQIISHHTMADADRQTLMFSATFPEEVQHLAAMFLTNYLFVAVGVVGGACSDVEQKFFSVTKFNKRAKLLELLSQRESSKCLVFVELKRMADFVATYLCEKNFPATSIHGDREQREREEALRDFKTGKMDVLVATSVAARGLDIKDVAHVLNFDLPSTIDEYVHRIGRTGRVGNRGLATSFFDPDRDSHLAAPLIKILEQAGQEVPDFLREAADEGALKHSGIPADFGGDDYRQNRAGFAKAETFEDEQW